MPDTRENLSTTGDRKSTTVGPAESPSSGAVEALDANRLSVGEGTHRRYDVVSSTALSQTTQRLNLSYFTARVSESITSLRVYTGGTAAAATPTLIRLGVWEAGSDGALSLLVASTPNDTTLLAATFTPYTKALSASWDKRLGQRYAIGLLVVTAAAAPIMMSTSGSLLGSIMVQTPRLVANVNTQADLPATVAVGSLSVNTGYGLYAEMVP